MRPIAVLIELAGFTEWDPSELRQHTRNERVVQEVGIHVLIEEQYSISSTTLDEVAIVASSNPD